MGILLGCVNVRGTSRSQNCSVELSRMTNNILRAESTFNKLMESSEEETWYLVQKEKRTEKHKEIFRCLTGCLEWESVGGND